MTLPLSSQPLSSPPIQIPKAESEASENPALLENLPFASLSSEERAFSSKIAQLNERIERDLDSLLFTRGTQIENRLANLENAQHDLKIVKSLIEIQNWTQDVTGDVKDVLKIGASFLKDMLPKSFVQKGSHLGFLVEHVEEMNKLGGAFLTAVDNGSMGAALIYKGKILQATKEALSKLKAEFITHKRELGEIEKNLSGEIQKLAIENHKAELSDMKASIKDLEKNLKSQEEEWRKEIINFVKKPGSTHFLPLQYLLTVVQGIVSGFEFSSKLIYAGSSDTLGLIFSFYALKTEIDATKLFQKFTGMLNKWKTNYQDTVTIGREPSPSPINAIPERRVEDVSVDTLKAFDNEFGSLKSIEEVRKKLASCGIELPSMTLFEFRSLLNVEKLPPELVEIKEKVLSSYNQYQETLKGFDHVIQTSSDLYVKRQTIMKKKIFLATPQFDKLLPKIKELKEKEFLIYLKGVIQSNKEIKDMQSDLQALSPPIQLSDEVLQLFINQIKKDSVLKMPPLVLESFQKWFNEQIPQKETLLRFYIDHHSTLEQVTKNALVQMVSKKQEVDKVLIDLKLAQSITFFGLSIVMMGVSVALWILGLATVPLGGAGFILLGLSVPSTLLSIGFYAAQLKNSRSRHSELNKEYMKGTSIKLLYANLRSAFVEYKQNNLQKKVLAIANIVQSLHDKPDLKDDATYKKALKDYEKAKREFEENQKQVEKWGSRLDALQSKLTVAAWKDFAQLADLKIDPTERFDTLSAFDQALRQTDLTLLSPETKEILEVHLGFNIEQLQATMNNNPDIIKNTLQKFFSLTESEYLEFMSKQKKRLSANIIQVS